MELRRKDGNELVTPDYSYFADNGNDFEIIEDQEEINIQDIKEFNEIRDLSEWSNKTLSENQRAFNIKINEIIKGLKQLDNKIKESK